RTLTIGHEAAVPVIHLLPPEPKRDATLFLGADSEVNEGLIHVEPILVRRSRPANAAGLDAALQFDEGPGALGHPHVSVKHDPLKVKAVVVFGSCAPIVVVVELKERSELSSKRYVPLVVRSQRDGLDRIPPITALCFIQQEAPILVAALLSVRGSLRFSRWRLRRDERSDRKVHQDGEARQTHASPASPATWVRNHVGVWVDRRYSVDAETVHRQHVHDSSPAMVQRSAIPCGSEREQGPHHPGVARCRRQTRQAISSRLRLLMTCWPSRSSPSRRRSSATRGRTASPTRRLQDGSTSDASRGQRASSNPTTEQRRWPE